MKNGSKFWNIFWISTAAIVMAGMFLFGYHSPIKTNEKTQVEVYKMLTLQNEEVIKNTIQIDPYIGSLEIDGKNREVQDFSFITINDSVTKTYNGWILVGRKFMGYDIDTVIVSK